MGTGRISQLLRLAKVSANGISSSTVWLACWFTVSRGTKYSVLVICDREANRVTLHFVNDKSGGNSGYEYIEEGPDAYLLILRLSRPRSIAVATARRGASFPNHVFLIPPLVLLTTNIYVCRWISKQPQTLKNQNHKRASNWQDTQQHSIFDNESVPCRSKLGQNHNEVEENNHNMA